MKDRVVGEELDIAWLELHLEIKVRAVGNFLIEVEQVALLGSEARHFRVALDGAEVVAVVERAQFAVSETARRHREVRWAVASLLVAGVEEERLVEPLDEIRTTLQQLVVHRHRTDYAATASRLCRAQAQ